MARSQARVLVSIWSDVDFLALPPSPQRLYLFLLSQPNLNHAGLLPLTVKRWARMATSLTVDDINNDLARLEADQFIVVDEDTEELLVRTLVKNDGVWKQPKVMPAMAANAAEIVSPLLQFALRRELEALDLTVLKDETRHVVEPIMARAIGTLSDTPPDTVPDTVNHAQNEPVGTVSDSPSDTPLRATRAASASTPASTSASVTLAPAEPKQTRPPDHIWDALLDACGIDEVTDAARGAYNRATADLRKLDATPNEIRRRAAIYRGQWPGASLTPTALVRRWGECVRPGTTTGPPPSRNEQILSAARIRAQAAENQTNRKAIG